MTSHVSFYGGDGRRQKVGKLLGIAGVKALYNISHKAVTLLKIQVLDTRNNLLYGKILKPGFGYKRRQEVRCQLQISERRKE